MKIIKVLNLKNLTKWKKLNWYKSLLFKYSDLCEILKTTSVHVKAKRLQNFCCLGQGKRFRWIYVIFFALFLLKKPCYLFFICLETSFANTTRIVYVKRLMLDYIGCFDSSLIQGLCAFCVDVQPSIILDWWKKIHYFYKYFMYRTLISMLRIVRFGSFLYHLCQVTS